MTLPLTQRADGVAIAVRLTPRAAADRIRGLARNAAGAPVLLVSVTAVPEKGKANAALIRLLAKAWSVPKTSLTVISGASDRNKVILASGDPARLTERIGTQLNHLTAATAARTPAGDP